MLKIPQKIKFVIDTLLQNGYDAYIVGGCVRDMLMGKKPEDYDVTTAASPQTVMSLFEKTVPTGIKHGTVTVIIDSQHIEVTTFRNDGSYSDNRHPENVEFVTDVKEDLARRDFTVNAMAYNEKKGLIDYFGGQADIKNKILRTVGNPQERFSEDALRILRLFRFASVLNFSIEENTLNKALKLSENLKTISKERIAVEIKKAVRGENFKVFEALILNGGLSFLNINRSPDYETVLKCAENEILSLFAFLYTCKCDINLVADNLKLSNNEKNYLLKLEKLCNKAFPNGKSEIKECLFISNENLFEDYLSFCEFSGEDVSETQKILEEILNNKEPYLVSHLKINGEDLKRAGYKGEKIGEVLEFARQYAVNYPEKNNKKDLELYIKNL